jgi:hypothetical protein
VPVRAAASSSSIASALRILQLHLWSMSRSCGGIWAKCSANLRSRKSQRSKEGHLTPDHVHMLLSTPKYAISQVVGFI